MTRETLPFKYLLLGGGGDGGGRALVGVEGKDVRLECVSAESGRRCSWRTPYERTYRLQPGEYAERGRIQAGTLWQHAL